MKYYLDFKVSSYQVDAKEELKPASFMDMAQEAAYLASDAMHFGFNDLQEEHTVWVLSRMYIKFLRHPKWGEKLELSTWYKGQMGPFCIRDFRLKDNQGYDVVLSTTAWTVIDVQSRKMVRGDDINKFISSDFVCNDSVFEDSVGKVIIPKELEKEYLGERIAAYSDIDVVGHTNNARYLAWAMDCMDYDYLSTHSLQEVTINFNHETRPGEKITLQRCHINDTWNICGYSGDTQSFAIQLKFAELCDPAAVRIFA